METGKNSKANFIEGTEKLTKHNQGTTEQPKQRTEVEGSDEGKLIDIIYLGDRRRSKKTNITGLLEKGDIRDEITGKRCNLIHRLLRW